MNFLDRDLRTSNILTGTSAIGQRRSNIEIIAEILRLGLRGAGKTEIMYTVNMSYAQMQRYLDSLVKHGFISSKEKTKTMKSYHVTGDGIKLLETIDTLLKMLAPQAEQ